MLVLAAFLEVWQAVHHAHQRGIIRRDLKLSSILVPVENGQFCGVCLASGNGSMSICI